MKYELQVVTLPVTDIEAGRRELTERGVSVSAIRHESPIDGWKGDWEPGTHAQRRDYASLADPDGNTWVLQEIGFRAPARLPGANPDLTQPNSHPVM